jgi:hypothetical protein
MIQSVERSNSKQDLSEIGALIGTGIIIMREEFLEFSGIKSIAIVKRAEAKSFLKMSS